MSNRRRIIAWLLALVGSVVVVLLLSVIAIAVFGVSIDVSRWRNAIAARASAALGRPVTLDGRLELELGRETGLHVAGVRILNPPGFATPELATLREARARIDLLAALQGHLRVHSFEAEDGRVRLERAADGRVNWTAATSVPPASRTQSSSVSPMVAVEIERTSIHHFAFELHDQRSGASHFFDLDELTGIGGWSEPLKLNLRGSVAKSFPYAISIAGGSARLLQEGREAWPFALELEVLGTRLHADGTVDIAAGATQFNFRAGTEDLEQIGRFLHASLPRLGAAALTGTVSANASTVELKDLHGVLGASELAGGLVLTRGVGRPRVSGELAITTLDVQPFLDATQPRTERPLTYDEWMRQKLPVRSLLPVDADVVLSVGRWLGFAVDVRDAQIALHADERGVRAPISATIAGVPLTGRIDLETAASTSTLALELTARRVRLPGLRESFPSASSVDGSLGSVDLRAGARGDTLGALLSDLELRLAVKAMWLRYAGPAGRRPVDLTLDALEVVIPRGQPVRGTARGKLLGARATLAFRASELPRMLREPATPIKLQVAAAGATARIEGTLARPGGAPGSDLAFTLEARHAGDLAGWLGFAPESRLPVAVRGRVRLASGGWHFEDTTLKLGRSELTLDAHRAGTLADPVLVVAARSPLIDIPELSTLYAHPTRAQARSPQAWLDVPILLQGIELPAADIGLGLKRVVLGRTELVDVGVSARIRDGRLVSSPFSARFAGVPFEGFAGLDLRGAVPAGSLSMAASHVDVGALLRRLGVADDIDAHAGVLQVKLDGSARSVGEFLQRGSLEARLLGGEVSVRGPADRAIAEVKLEQALVTAQPGKPLTLQLQGAVSDVPAQITISTGTLADLARDASVVPFSVKADAAGARLTLDGRVMLPLGHGADLTLELAGEQLDSLNEFARAALPPWKAWSMQGPVSMTPTGYEVTQLAVKVGESRLNGRGRIDLAGPRPRLDVYLSAPHLQLDDFPIATQAVAPRLATLEGMRATAGRTAAFTQDLLSAAFLRRLDANLDISVEQVLSGSDRLAAGMLRATLVDGRLEVSPAEIYVPGGSARMSLSYDSTGPQVALAAGVHVDRFDYGVLARRMRPGTDLAGLISLNLELSGKAPTLSAIMAHADGRIDIAVWPKNLRGGVINRWAVNVFFALLPFVDSTPQARVNCAIFRLDLRNGVLTHDLLLIDTGRVRVFGAGGADFATEEIGFRFRPRVKGLTFFSLQPPVDVTGTMTDFRIGLARGHAPATITRFLSSTFVEPIRLLTRGTLPRDGADVCSDPMR